MNRGTPSWAVYHMRAIGLPRLIDDLDRHEATGIPETACDKIKAALAALIKQTEAAKDSFWSPCVSSDVNSFREAYVKWNGREQGADLVDRAFRRAQIEELRGIREKMKRALGRGRANGDLLATAADKDLADAFYQAFDALFADHPELFPGLGAGARAYARGPKSKPLAA